MKTPHPTYPLRDEERDEIIKAMDSPKFTHHDVLEIRERYEAQRNRLFPGWLEQYNAEMAEWFKTQRA